MRHDHERRLGLAGTQEGMFAGARWRYVPTASLPADQIANDIETALSQSERTQYDSFKSPERKLSWLRGRIVAKRLILETTVTTAQCASDLDLVTRNERGQGIPIEVHHHGNRLPLHVSLSHTPDGILAAVGELSADRVGLDLTRLADVVPENLKPWLTPNEREAIASQGSESIATVWAMKEAIYKAACHDEAFSPLRIEAIPTQTRPGLGPTEWQCRFFGRPISPNRIAIKTWKLEGHIAAIVVLPQPARRPFEPHAERSPDSRFARSN